MSACPLLEQSGHLAIALVMLLVSAVGWAGYWAGSLGWARLWKRLVHGAPPADAQPVELLHGPFRGMLPHALSFVVGAALGALVLHALYDHSFTNPRFWYAALLSGSAIVVLNAVLMQYLLTRSLRRLDTRSWHYRWPRELVGVREVALLSLAILPMAAMTLLVNRRVVLEGRSLAPMELVSWLAQIGVLFLVWSALTAFLLRGIERRASDAALELIRTLDAPVIPVRAHVTTGGPWGETASALNVAADRLEERTRLERAVRTYVGDELADASRSTDVTQRKGERVHMTLLFADIRGFTSRSADAEPGAIVGLLDRYFERAADVIAAHGGHVDKFIGDGLMAWFEQAAGASDLGAPRAHAAALHLLSEVEALNAVLAAEGVAPIAIGVGLNGGVVVRGNLGAGRRKQWTVIGDVVNLASRLEGMTKDIHRPLVYTQSVAAHLPPDASDLLGEYEVRGQPRPVTIYAAARI